ncbi:zinc finger protein 184-like isoform X1 [Tribolium madens]|uniref:zinc finger protein 184-like isoform X1 n=2 Tax=Tribolium madens TaxID=41895 RepID=UPI001CF72837|nr:zinc finger protein 184-like isoform X1 [Tribolium madens]
MENAQERDFHRSLEPDVIINHELSEDEEEVTCIKSKDVHSSINGHPKTVQPDISIIPLNKKPQIKIKLFKKEYSPSKDDTKVQSISRSPRQTVRLVSKDEAERAGDTYTRRKSLPLEKCHICKKFFRRMKTHLLKHEQTNRNPNDPLTCTFCMKGFNTQSNLLIHMRTHTGDKPYVCEVCHKGFAQSCNLVNHVRIHTGERPFKCPHCDRAFTQSGNLNNHIRLHTDEKPFKCHFCDKAFVQSGNLNSHIRNNHKFVDDGANDSVSEKVEEYKC